MKKKTACQLSPFLFSKEQETLSRIVKHVKETQGLQMEKEEVKVFLFTGDMTLYIKYLKGSPRKVLQLINTLCKVE